MPFIVLEGITVEAAAQQQSSTQREVGDRTRAFDGTMLSSIRDRKREWSIVTIPITRPEADTLIAALDNAPPLAASGDLFGVSTDVHAVLDDVSYRIYADGQFAVVSFTLFEA